MAQAEKLFSVISRPELAYHIEGFLQETGFNIAFRADHLSEVARQIPEAQAAVIRAAIVLGDPSFDGGQFTHGKQVTRLMRDGIPGIFVVGLGVSNTPDFGDKNLHVLESRFPEQLVNSLLEIPQRRIQYR